MPSGEFRGGPSLKREKAMRRDFWSLPVTISLAVALAGCTSTVAEPSPTVTLTQTATVTASPPAPQPQPTAPNPVIQDAVMEACWYLNENEPSWDSLTEAGPFEGVPMDVQRVLRYAKQGEDAYRGAAERLDLANLFRDGDMAYGMVYAGIDARVGLASALRFRAEEYLRTGDDYDSVYYFWAAYTASVESKVPACRDYSW